MILCVLGAALCLSMQSAPDQARIRKVEWRTAREVNLDLRAGLMGPEGHLFRYRRPGERLFSLDFDQPASGRISAAILGEMYGREEGYLAQDNVFWLNAPSSGLEKKIEFQWSAQDASEADLGYIQSLANLKVGPSFRANWISQPVSGATLRAFDFSSRTTEEGIKMVRFAVDYRLAASAWDTSLDFLPAVARDSRGNDLGLQQAADDGSSARRVAYFEYRQPSDGVVSVTLRVQGFAWGRRNPDKVRSWLQLVPDPGVVMGSRVNMERLSENGIPVQWEKFELMDALRNVGSFVGRAWLPGADETGHPLTWVVSNERAFDSSGNRLDIRLDAPRTPSAPAPGMFHMNGLPGGPDEFGIDVVLPWDRKWQENHTQRPPSNASISFDATPFTVLLNPFSMDKLPVPPFGTGQDIKCEFAPEGKSRVRLERMQWITPNSSSGFRQEVGTSAPYALALRIRLFDATTKGLTEAAETLMLTDMMADGKYYRGEGSAIETNKPGVFWMVVTPPPPGSKLLRLRFVYRETAQQGTTKTIKIPEQQLPSLP
ncbi:MAG: hypothetical protein JSS72_09645 [Armatimonadetes bacterium]|nr:hypothetical protein [Armatimonadota bacterium]